MTQSVKRRGLGGSPDLLSEAVDATDETRLVMTIQRPRRSRCVWIIGCGLLASLLACQEDVTSDGRFAWDRDGDSISVAVELDSINNSLYHFDTSEVDRNPSLARGTPGAGSLDSGLHLPDNGTGYYHHPGSDTLPGGAPAHTDDWGVLALLNTVEAAARCWDQAARRRTGILDLSLQAGDSFPQHAEHRNGLDVDVRYVRRGGQAQDTFGLDLEANPNDLDTNATRTLWNCFVESPRVEFIIIDGPYFQFFILPHPKLRFDRDTVDRVHRNHFHVRILDPDGTGN